MFVISKDFFKYITFLFSIKSVLLRSKGKNPLGLKYQSIYLKEINYIFFRIITLKKELVIYSFKTIKMLKYVYYYF